jgi:hypothetical protein
MAPQRFFLDPLAKIPFFQRWSLEVKKGLDISWVRIPDRLKELIFHIYICTYIAMYCFNDVLICIVNMYLL